MSRSHVAGLRKAFALSLACTSIIFNQLRIPLRASLAISYAVWQSRVTPARRAWIVCFSLSHKLRSDLRCRKI